MRLLIFVALTFALDWGLIAVYLGMGGELRGVQGMLVSVAYMFGPGVAAVIVQRAVVRAPVRGPLGVSFRLNRWFAVGWLLPAVLAFASVGVAVLLPDVTFSPGTDGLLERLPGLTDPAHADEVRRQIESLPVHPAWLVLLQGLIFGATVNAVAAFGEELGWRGFMHKELQYLGFWRAALVTGIVWGVWHAPLILLGHNYPEHPVAGVVMMIAFTTLLSPVISVIRIRSDSVVAASIMHGTINGTAGIPLMLLAGGSDLSVGLTGIAGLAVLAAANIVLFLAPRLTRE